MINLSTKIQVEYSRFSMPRFLTYILFEIFFLLLQTTAALCIRHVYTYKLVTLYYWPFELSIGPKVANGILCICHTKSLAPPAFNRPVLVHPLFLPILPSISVSRLRLLLTYTHLYTFLHLMNLNGIYVPKLSSP